MVATSTSIDASALAAKKRRRFIWLIIISAGVSLWYFNSTNTAKQDSRKVERPSADGRPKPRPPSPVSRNEILDLAAFVENVAYQNARGIEAVLVIATSDPSPEVIKAAAILSGRDYNFATNGINRNRKVARGLHDPVRESLTRPGDLQRICDVIRSALYADLLDVEIAGNLAMCFFRVGQFKQSLTFAMYALSIPRAADKTGRTADWVTLAAAYAALGDQGRARGALYVSLGIAPSIERRCESAIYAVLNIYGQALQDATFEMLKRASTMTPQRAPECAIPDQWYGRSING